MGSLSGDTIVIVQAIVSWQGFGFGAQLCEQVGAFHRGQVPVKSRIQYARFSPKIEVRQPGCV